MKTLIIAPHMDDETISCAGLIQARRREGIEVIVVVTHNRSYDYGRQSGWKDEYPNYCAAKEVLDFHMQSAGRPATEGEPGEVGYYRLLETVEFMMKKWEPDEIIIPAGDDLNQDHRHLNHVCGIALRPINLGKVDRVLSFFALDGIVRQPSYYVPMDQKAMDTKLKALSCYTRESRVEGPRSPVNLTAQHRVWGAQCGSGFAEGYRLIFQREKLRVCSETRAPQ